MSGHDLLVLAPYIWTLLLLPFLNWARGKLKLLDQVPQTNRLVRRLSKRMQRVEREMGLQPLRFDDDEEDADDQPLQFQGRH